MERERFDEIATKLNYSREKWLMLHEIDSIVLKSGRGFYPDWKHIRFMLTKDGKLLAKHGLVLPYGARLSGLINVSGDYTTLVFTRTKNGIPIENSSFYNEWFEQPKAGDTIRATENLTHSYGESVIKEVMGTINSVVVYLWTPLRFPNTGKLSFYKTDVLSSDVDNCIHGTIHEGIYMQFKANTPGKKSKFGVFHEEIKHKDIKEINLRVGAEYFNKTYKLE